MSRCFPFPPPGYEKKSRVEDTDLLSKEKHKEKKHKKDKKEKEKREGKEKKDKDRSKDKHRDKKDRKDKHKDRDKEKNRTSDEKRVEGQPGVSVGEKFGSNTSQNSDSKDSKYVQELAKRIRDEGTASGSQMVQKIAVPDQRSGPQGMAVESSIASHQEGKRKINERNEDPRKANGQRNHIDGRGLEKTFGEYLSSMDRERVEGISKPVEKKDVERQMEGKEKIKDKEADGKSGKHKDKDREKSRKSKDKDRDKEKKKEEKAKEMTELSKEQPKLKESSPNMKHSSPKLKESSPKLKESSPKLKGSSKDSLDFRNARPSDPLKLSGINSADEGNPGKRKELEMNGYLLDNGIRPSKFPRPLPSSHPVIENGRKLESSQTAVQFAPEKLGPCNNSRPDIKEHKLNGLMANQQLNVSSRMPLSTKVSVNQNGEASEKPPHPDLKYLDVILSVPKMEECPDFIDNEWLFSNSHLQSKKPSVNSPGVDRTRQVWAEALHIESADISALPYVIPY
ncbi:hypothetical protein Tsubulata_048234 [Turnera subulata]|uniref:Uncharacterized protein n=1 Tax=Turnera subulata TaxID=218843 RepID=A0A9Q0J8N5_9ROSI|nr:hypothetical protein Tsubulata_048234 [Turnera subulata]